MFSYHRSKINQRRLYIYIIKTISLTSEKKETIYSASVVENKNENLDAETEEIQPRAKDIIAR